MNWSKFSPSSDDTHAHSEAACTRPGSAISAFITTPPPIERPINATRSSSTGTSEARNALTAAMTSAE